MDENEDNFVLELTAPEHRIVMKDGKLEIDGIEYEDGYEDNGENPTYDLVREIWRLRRKVDHLSSDIAEERGG